MCLNCHVVAVSIQIRNLDALEAAVKRLGGTLHRGKTSYKWYGRWVNDYHKDDAAYKHGVRPEDYGKCAHAISFPGCQYEVGVVQDGDEYKLIWDFIDGRLRTVLGGNDASYLVQGYAVELQRQIATANGYAVEESVDQDGNVQLVCTMY